MNRLQKRIEEIDKRLKELRKDWVVASPVMKRFIEKGAELLKAERRSVVSKIESIQAAENQGELIQKEVVDN